MTKRKSMCKGQVWMVDLGLAAKLRPCLLLTGFPSDEELALVTVVAHITALKGNPWELEIKKPFLRKGAFHLQQIHSIPLSAFVRFLGILNTDEMKKVEQKIMERLDFKINVLHKFKGKDK
jgi:mRNA interferase MazF